MRLF
jgi:hypothetical protein